MDAFFELSSAGNWQYPGLLTQTKGGFPQVSISSSSRSENVGIHFLDTCVRGQSESSKTSASNVIYA